MIVGMVDSNGFGVPFMLCRRKTSKIVNKETATEEIRTPENRFFILPAMEYNSLISIPPKRKV